MYPQSLYPQSNQLLRRPYRRYAVRRRPVAARVAAVERSVGKLNSLVETKYVDRAFTGQASQILPATIPINADSLTGIDGGTFVTQKVGTTVTVKNLYLRYSIQAYYDSTGFSPFVNTARVLVIWHEHWDGSAPKPISYYLHTAFTPEENVLAYNEWSNRRAFKVLHDQIYFMVHNEADSMHRGGSFKIPINRQVVYNTNTLGSNSEIEQGAIWIYFLVDSPNAGTAKPFYDFMTRLTFQDA